MSHFWLFSFATLTHMFKSSNVSRVFFKTKAFFCRLHHQGPKTHGGLPKTRKTLSDSRVFWLIFFEFGDMFSSKFGTTSKPNPKSFFWAKLGGHLGSKSQFGNCRLTNCLARFFQNPFIFLQFSRLSHQFPLCVATFSLCEYVSS